MEQNTEEKIGYVTKYALTQGILKVKILSIFFNEHISNPIKYYKVTRDDWDIDDILKIDIDCFTEENKAIQKAEQMRNKKLSLLQKQYEKLSVKQIKIVD